MRCKRCGSIINYEDVMCKGCGRSLVDLKAQNEIEFDENATVNVEPIRHDETPKVIEEEKKVDDIFGDAIYGENNEEVIEPVVDVPLTEPQVTTESEVPSYSTSEGLEVVSNQNGTVTEEAPEQVDSNPSIPLNQEITESVSTETINAEPLSNVVENNTVSEEQNIVVEENESAEPIAPKSVEAVSANKSDDEDFIPKKKSKKGLVIIIITLIILALAGVVAYFYVKTNPKSIFETSVNKLFSYANIDKISSDKVKSEMYLKLNIDANEDNPIYDVINNLDLGFSIHVDETNKNIMLALDSKYEGSELLKATMYGTNNKIYGLLNNIYDKYISLDIEEGVYKEIFEEDGYDADLKTIIEELNNEVNKSLDKKYFTRSIDGMNAISTFALNKESYIEFAKTLLTNIKNNDKFINSVAKLSEKDANTIKQEIDAEITNFSAEMEEFKVVITSNILDGMIKKVEMSTSSADSKITFIIDVVDNKTYNFNITVDDSNIKGTLKIEEKNGFDEYAFTIDESEFGKVTYTIGYKLTENEALTIPSLEDTVSYTELTEEEFNTILTNLFQNEGIVKLYEIFSTMESENGEVNENIYPDENPIIDENIDYGV